MVDFGSSLIPFMLHLGWLLAYIVPFSEGMGRKRTSSKIRGRGRGWGKRERQGERQGNWRWGNAQGGSAQYLFWVLRSRQGVVIFVARSQTSITVTRNPFFSSMSIWSCWNGVGAQAVCKPDFRIIRFKSCSNWSNSLKIKHCWGYRMHPDSA